MGFDVGNDLQVKYNDDYGEAFGNSEMEVIDAGEVEPFDGDTVSVEDLMGFVPSSLRGGRLWKGVFGEGTGKQAGQEDGI